MGRVLGGWIVWVCVLMGLVGLCGCNSYAVPGRGAELGLMTSSSGDSGELDGGTGTSWADVAVVRREPTAVLSTREACDKVRLATEREAFASFLDEFEVLWPKLVENYKK